MLSAWPGRDAPEWMSAVGNLNGVGIARINCFDVTGRTVPADDLSPRMFQKPLLDCFRGAIRKQIKRTMGFQIHKNRSIRMATPQGRSSIPRTFCVGFSPMSVSRTRRLSVSGLVGSAKLRMIFAPASLPAINPTSRCDTNMRFVRRAYDSMMPDSRSVNVHLKEDGFSQENQRLQTCKTTL